MVKIGLTNFRYSILDTSATTEPVYSGAKTLGKAISCNVEIESNDASLYADDTLVETDTSFQKGTVTIGIDEEDITTMAALLGHTVSSSSPYIMTRKSSDIAPYVGLGRIVTKMINGAYKYKVEFLYKVKFSEPQAENNTRGESTEFGTYELEWTIAALSDGSWFYNATVWHKSRGLNVLRKSFGGANAVTFLKIYIIVMTFTLVNFYTTIVDSINYSISFIYSATPITA